MFYIPTTKFLKRQDLTGSYSGPYRVNLLLKLKYPLPDKLKNWLYESKLF